SSMECLQTSTINILKPTSYHQHLSCYKIQTKNFSDVLDKGLTLHLKYGCNMEKSICNRRDQVKNTDEGAISLFLTVPASIKSGFEAKNLICNHRGMLAGGRTHSHVLIKLKNLCNEIILFRIYGHKGGEGEDAKFPPGCVRSRNISGIRNWRGAGGKAPVN
ncbi:MAG TPA: hypothetical protein H9997_11645, partial [Candidatus Sellimonas avistercoris]|nr:hypothetical protein [Candidatus Sellimonas avistercoris]